MAIIRKRAKKTERGLDAPACASVCYPPHYRSSRGELMATDFPNTAWCPCSWDRITDS